MRDRTKPDEGFLLGGVGVSPTEELTYRALLMAGPAELPELARLTTLSADVVRECLPRLEQLGLVSRLTGSTLRLVATPPQLAVDALAARRYDEVARARAAVGVLADEARRRDQPRPEELLEVVTGRAAVARSFAQLNTAARKEVRALVQPPFAVDLAVDPTSQADALGRGIRARSIYDPAAFESSRLLELTRRLVAVGEEARVGRVPLKLLIVDATAAMIPLTSGSAHGPDASTGNGVGRTHDTTLDSAVVVRPSALLDALISLFEMLWSSASPLDGVPVPASTRADGSRAVSDAEILSLLAAGFKDDTVARQLGLSLRSLQRRLQSIFADLDARTRFQAGVQAARTGLLHAPARPDPPARPHPSVWSDPSVRPHPHDPSVRR